MKMSYRCGARTNSFSEEVKLLDLFELMSSSQFYKHITEIGGVVMRSSGNGLLKAVQLVCVGVIILVGGLFIQRPAAASAGTNVLFILDGSGSMWARLDNIEKIVIAKERLSVLVKELPEGVNIGLMVYGHRSKGDCNDIEL